MQQDHLFNPQTPGSVYISDEDQVVQTLTFSTFSTVKSRLSGVAAILPGVSISPPKRSCQMIKEEQHIQQPPDTVTLPLKENTISNMFPQ